MAGPFGTWGVHSLDVVDVGLGFKRRGFQVNYAGRFGC